MDAEHSISELKKCTKCGETKPATVEYFRAEKRTIIGLQSKCLVCEREYNRERRAKNPSLDREYYQANKHWLLPKMNEAAKSRRRDNRGAVLAAQRAWRAKNLDKAHKYQSDYYARNRDSEIKRIQEYYEQNPDKRIIANGKREEWRKRNREQARTYVRNRRAKLKSSGGTHNGEDIKRLIAGQKGCCWWCGCKIPLGRHHVDHRIPIARGGSNGPENLVISCAPCNHKKSSKMPWEMDNPRLL